jgi:hypothetical protein
METMIDDKILRSYRLDDEHLRIYRDFIIENIQPTRSARVQDLVLIELISRELDRRAFGGFFAPDIDEEKNNE